MATNEPTIYLYVIGPEVGPVKVGRSMQPLARLKQLEGKACMRLFLTGQWPIGQAIGLAAERYAHWLLRDKSVKGEWFDVSRDEAVAAVERAITLDHYPHHAMPSLDTHSSEIPNGIYHRTKLARDVHARMHEASEGHHAAFIREAVERELEPRGK